jgi:hypothetical protein
LTNLTSLRHFCSIKFKWGITRINKWKYTNEKWWEIRDSQFDFKEIARADRLCNFAAVVCELILYSVCIQFAWLLNAGCTADEVILASALSLLATAAMESNRVKRSQSMFALPVHWYILIYMATWWHCDGTVMGMWPLVGLFKTRCIQRTSCTGW